MAPLLLEGATLGKRHHHYNHLLNDAKSTAAVKPPKVDYEKNDIENLFNIDIAINNKDVEYILDVLKGEDMLYASRAIKRSNWLINDDQYAHIINPEYLHSQLFPHMMAKASSKLLLEIRLTLKNESRVEKFFQYFKAKDLKLALKWLPSCPLSVIEDMVEKHYGEVSPALLRRLCERSSSVLNIFVKAHSGYYVNHLEAVMFILRSDPEKYLDALEKSDRFYLPKFGKNHTKVVMKKCPHRFIDSFEKYMYNIDLDTFARYLKKCDIKSFILKKMENKNVKSWFNQERISNFIKYMPKQDRYEFMKEFVDRKIEVKDNEYNDCVVMKCDMSMEMSCRSARGGGASNSSSYRWFKHAPFDVAFVELKKLIRSESNPDERNAMLMILVANARGNLKNILILLQYYREKHMNEPFRFKVQFINDLLHKTHPHLYNDDIWAILDEIFRSMEVYVESENNVQTCVKAIIAFKVTRNETVPAIIEKKFNFDSLKSLTKKMDVTQKEKLFAYVYNFFLNKLNKCKISNNAELAEYVEVLKQGLNLLNDWKKELKNYPVLIEKINECVQLKKQNDWSTSLTSLYEINKSWKKDMFEESLVLFPSHSVCMNALKHDPELLARHQAAVEALCRDDAARMERVLGKLRVYWPERAREWAAAHRARLRQPAGHAALLRGLCSLLPQRELLDFLKEHEPQESKINWADTDELELSLRKNIARNMHIARPQITPETVLWYAKGDYVQFTQPSLNAILYNLRPSHSREYVLQLLNGMISLQKHGVRLAFAKLQSSDIKQIFLDMWNSNKNASVRAALFQNTHGLLCKEKDEVLVADLWSLMQVFIDSLTSEENKSIFNTLSKLDKVHPSIKPAYCMKSYKFLKSLPPKADCKNVVQNLKDTINESIEHFDDDFLVSIILNFADNVLLTKSNSYEHRNDMDIFCSYLLCAGNEDVQLQRFEKTFVPLMEKAIPLWNNYNDDDNSYIRQNIQDITESLFRKTTEFAFKKSKVVPTLLFRKILAVFENSLPATQNYTLFRQLKLAIAFVDTLHKNMKADAGPIKDDTELNELHLNAGTDFTNLVIQYLKQDVDLFGPSVYVSFTEALDDTLSNFNFDRSQQIMYVEKLLNERYFIPMCLVAIQLLNSCYYNNDDQKKVAKLVHDLLRSHDAPEVQILYFCKFGSTRRF